MRRLGSILAFLGAVLSLTACGGPDKTAHFIAGAMVAEYVRYEGGSFAQACGASLAFGALKEVADSQFGGVVDSGDVWATGAGCAITWRF